MKTRSGISAWFRVTWWRMDAHLLEENACIGKLWYDQERVYFADDNPTRRADIVIENDTSIDAHTILRQLHAETRQSVEAVQPRPDADR